MSQSLLIAENLTGGYQTKSIIHQLNLQLDRGEWLSLLGSNGSGKSTLLKLLSHLLKPQQGIVWLDGKAIHTEPPHVVAQKMALLPQQQTVPSGLTVQQLVSLGRTPHQSWYQWELTAIDRSQVDQAMILTQVIEFADRSVESLSGGERQRAFLALARRADYLFRSPLSTRTAYLAQRSPAAARINYYYRSSRTESRNPVQRSIGNAQRWLSSHRWYPRNGNYAGNSCRSIWRTGGDY
jgi:ABC-type enterochelin transport system ATPase subunit